MKKLRIRRSLLLSVSVLLLLTSLSVFYFQIFRSPKKTQAAIDQLQIGGQSATNSFVGNINFPGGSKWTADGKLSIGTGTTVANSRLNVSGGAAFGSGNALIDTNGKIAAINTTNFANLSGANITALNADQLTTGTVNTARLSGTYGISVSGNAATATTANSVAWANVSGRPGWLGGGSYTESLSNANTWANSGFYENAGCGSNWPSCTWYNSLNVRHSNQGNYHGFQIAMSYYDNNLWWRSYQGGGTFQNWVYGISSANIGSQTVASAGNVGGWYFGGGLTWIGSYDSSQRLLNTNGYYYPVENARYAYRDSAGTVISASSYATHRGEGTNFIDYAYGLYDAYRGGWRTSNDLYVAYAYSAGNADSVDSQHFAWSNQNNNPTYLWAADSNGSAYLAWRAGMSVSYANTTGTATNVDGSGYVQSNRVTASWNGYGGYLRYSGSASTTYFSQGSTGDAWMRITTDDWNGYHNVALGSLYAGGATRFDLAEVTPVDPSENLKPGELVSTDPTHGVRLHRSRSANDTTLVGIVSNGRTASMVIGGDIGPEKMNLINDKKPIALAGRVITIVNTESGTIATGDAITSSTSYGVGMKQAKAGAYVAKAMENFDGSWINSEGVEQIINKLKTELATTKVPADKIELQKVIGDLTSSLPNGTGRIITFVDGGYYDPDTNLTSTDDLNVTVDAAGKAGVKNNNGTLISRVGAFAELIVAKLRVGVLEVKKLVVNGVDIVEKLNKLSATVEEQQKTIDTLKKEVETLKK